MEKTTVEAMGFAAAALTTLAPAFQLVKTVRSGKTDDLSLWMWIALLAGVILWLFYGIHIHSRPIIISNAVVLAVVLVMLGFIARNAIRRLPKQKTSPR